MSSAAVCVWVFFCTVVGLVLGMGLRARLPGHHLKDDSREVIKTASGIIGTLVALVLGLLVASSKSTFDGAAAGINQAASRVILLDRALERYGPEAEPLRVQLRQGLVRRLDQIWPRDGHAATPIEETKSAQLDHLEVGIQGLTPTTDVQRGFQSKAEAIAEDLVQSRWSLFVESHGELPGLFLAALIFWLFVLYLMLGLLTPRNFTAWGMLLLCVASVSLALFLVMEMNRPLHGAIRVSEAPLREALEIIHRAN